MAELGRARAEAERAAELAAELGRARAKAERAAGELLAVEGWEREAGLQLRVAEAKLLLLAGSAESAVQEAEALRAELASASLASLAPLASTALVALPRPNRA